MSANTLFYPQRRCERIYRDGVRVAWSRSVGESLRPAILEDQSESGIGVVVAEENAPRPGDSVRLLLRDVRSARCARVVRSSARSDGHVRLGCRWISGRDRSRALSHGHRGQRSYAHALHHGVPQ